MEELKQSRGFLRLEAKILNDGVLYRRRMVTDSLEIKVPFENISQNITRLFHVSRLYIVISIFFSVLFALRTHSFLTTNKVALGSLAWSLLLAVVAVGGTWMQSPRYIGYIAEPANLLFFDKKGSQDPTSFLEVLHNRRHQYLQAKYSQEHSSQEAAPVPVSDDEGLH